MVPQCQLRGEYDARTIEEWVVGLTDITARARKIATLAHTGQSAKARRLLSPERVYPVPRAIAGSLGIDEVRACGPSGGS